MNYMKAEKGNGKTLIYFLILMAFGAGIIFGSVYLARGWGDIGEGIKAYFDGLFSDFAENKSVVSVFKNSLVSALAQLGIIFIMGFFRAGFIGTGAVIIRKGFITGFTSAAFFRAYGARGMLIMLSTMPQLVVIMPAMIIYAAVSIGFSLTEDKFEKKIFFSYIFFTIFIISIFCAASFSEGFLTTTFMKILSPKLS